LQEPHDGLAIVKKLANCSSLLWRGWTCLR